MAKYTVIGHDGEDFDIWIIKQEAESPDEAAALALMRARKAAEDPEDITVNTVFEGWHENVLDSHVGDCLND